MADPFRLRVLKALTARIESISEADGFNFTLAGNVFRGRLMFSDQSDPIPLVAINEAPLPDDPIATPASGTQWVGPWNLYIQGWVDDDIKNPTDPAHLLMADVRKAIAIERRKALPKNDILGMGGRVMDIRFGGCSVRPAEEFVSAYANFMLAVTLQIAEFTDDPYA